MDGSTPLRVACVSGYSRVGSFLIEHGAHVDATMSDNSTSLMVAALQGNRHEVKMLVKNGANVNQKTQPQGRTALHYAAQGRFSQRKLKYSKKCILFSFVYMWVEIWNQKRL